MTSGSSDPGPLDGLAWLLMGLVAILFRRSFAERMSASVPRDEVFGVDRRVAAIILFGCLAIVAGLATFLIWLTA
jgi:MYXO-CTERM domain-containing protein